MCFNIYQNKHFKPYLVLNQNYETYIINIVYI